MSDNQRRFVCRLVFLAFCALPTFASFYKICHPQTATGWAQTIQASLGVPTRVGSIQTPNPNVTILHGLEFTDPELGTLINIVEARVYFDEFNTVYIPYRIPNLTSRGLNRFIRSLNNNLIQHSGFDRPWQIVFEKQLLVQEYEAARRFEQHRGELPPEIALNAMQVDIIPEIEGTRAYFRFKLDGQEENSNPIQAVVAKADEDGYQVHLDTQEMDLPLWLVSDSYPQLLQDLGRDCDFNGQLVFAPKIGQDWLLLDGQLSQVDLQRFGFDTAQDRFANLELSQCQFENGVPIEWDAKLRRPNQTYPVRIAREDLITYSQNVSLDKAIQMTLEKEIRIASPQRNLR